jgi:hypothetical protein
VPTGEKHIVTDEERLGVLLNEYCEGGVNLAFSAGLHDLELDAPHPRRFPYVSNPRVCIIRVHKQSDYSSLGNQLRKHLEPFECQIDCEDA